MAKTSATTAPETAAPVEEAVTVPEVVTPSWFAADPYAATLAATPNWPTIPPKEPAATVDESTAPA
jgi:hypothetical protein